MATDTMTDNELIAEFMGQRVTPVGLRREVMQKSYYANELKYDTSWDWLMPVVEKIESLGYTFEIKSDQAALFRDNVKYAFAGGVIGISGKLSAVHEMVVEFIKWYNTQTKQQ
jgi:hypothetical protein